MIGKTIQVKTNQDSRGLLLAINRIPFEAQRMFFITNVPEGTIRGDHFSKTSSFLYILIQGGCKVDLDDGIEKETHHLVTGDGILFPPETWMKIYDFTTDAILCILADTEYRQHDYISDYEEFIRIVRKKNV